MARRSNPIRFELKAHSLPQGTTVVEYYRRLVEYLRDRRPLPSSWDVELSWRNPGSSRAALSWKWDSSDFETAIDESEGVGLFNQFVLERMESNLARALQAERYQRLWERRQRLVEERKKRRKG